MYTWPKHVFKTEKDAALAEVFFGLAGEGLLWRVLRGVLKAPGNGTNFTKLQAAVPTPDREYAKLQHTVCVLLLLTIQQPQPISTAVREMVRARLRIYVQQEWTTYIHKSTQTTELLVALEPPNFYDLKNMYCT